MMLQAGETPALPGVRKDGRGELKLTFIATDVSDISAATRI